MTSTEILSQLKSLGSESIKKVLVKHGAREPFYGVKVEELKKIQKKVKSDYKLSLELFDSGISDAMYLAGLIADPEKMTKKDLNHWADMAYWSMLSEYTVPWVAAESPHAMAVALDWIESDREGIAAAGWCTLSSYAGVTADDKLDIALYKKLAERVVKEIHQAPNRVRHCMNGYLIAVGSSITSLTPHILKLAEKVGEVTVDMGGTACRVPDAIAYIKKIEAKGNLGKKKKMARC